MYRLRRADSRLVLANAVFAIHLAFVGFILTGWLFDGVTRDAYTIFLALELILFLLRAPCPLTILESKLRGLPTRDAASLNGYLSYYGVQLVAVAKVKPSDLFIRIMYVTIVLWLGAELIIQAAILS